MSVSCGLSSTTMDLCALRTLLDWRIRFHNPEHSYHDSVMFSAESQYFLSCIMSCLFTCVKYKFMWYDKWRSYKSLIQLDSRDHCDNHMVVAMLCFTDGLMYFRHRDLNREPRSPLVRPECRDDTFQQGRQRRASHSLVFIIAKLTQSLLTQIST